MCVLTSELSTALCITFLPRFLYPGKISWEAFHIFEKLETEAKNKWFGWNLLSNLLPVRPELFTPSNALQNHGSVGQRGNRSVGTDVTGACHLSTFVLPGSFGVTTHVSFSRVGGDPRLAWGAVRKSCCYHSWVCTLGHLQVSVLRVF